jgi:hypothetical protein
VAQPGGPGKGHVWRLVAGLPLIFVGVGFAADACLGLPVSRGSASLPALLGGLMALGGLYVLGEAVGEWTTAWDKVSDPLWKRVLHLLTLLAVAAVVMMVVALLTGRAF